MDKKEVVNVDLVDVPHVRIEVKDEERLEELYEAYGGLDPSALYLSEIFNMRNRFESCFIVYRESMPDIMFYAQE